MNNKALASVLLEVLCPTYFSAKIKLGRKSDRE